MRISNKQLLILIIITFIRCSSINGYTYFKPGTYELYDNKQLKQRYSERWHRFPAAQARYQMGADPYLKPSFSDIPEQPNISGFEQESYNSPK